MEQGISGESHLRERRVILLETADIEEGGLGADFRSLET
jgi:hypothetical protein